MANFLATNGTTWTFDKEVTLTGASNTYQYGTYCNGNYWIVGPVTIISISPAWNGSYNGAELNVIADGWNQGLTTAGTYYTGTYEASRNVALSIPRTIQPNSSLLSSNGRGQCSVYNGERIFVSANAVLTVVSSPPAAGSFRPGYAGTTKTIMGNESDLRYDRLGRVDSVTAPSSITALSTHTARFSGVWPAHLGGGWMPYPILPCGPASGYAVVNVGKLGEAMLACNCNYTQQEKRDLVVALVQQGIDRYSVMLNQAPGNPMARPDGGHGMGEKYAIMFAGAILDNADMLNFGEKTGVYLYSGGYGAGNAPPDHIYSSPDNQTFYVKQADVDRGVGYSSGDIGTPEWQIEHADTPSYYRGSDPAGSWGADYRTCCTASGWIAATLAIHIMSFQGINLRNLWNNYALFDYIDRYWSIEGTGGWAVNRQPNPGWVRGMWDTYRAAYGPVWPDSGPADTTPPSAPSSLISPQQSDTTINLNWTAAGQASDGDYPVGYRIYRDLVLVGSVTGTSFIDTGLAANTSYDYKIYSYDDASNESTSSADNTFSTEAAPSAVTTVYINGNGSSSNGGTSWTDAIRDLPSTLTRGATYYIGTGFFGVHTFNEAKNSNTITIQKATLTNHGSDTGWNPAYAGQAQWGNLVFNDTSYIDFRGGSVNQTLVEHSGVSVQENVIYVLDSDYINIDYTEISGMNGGIGNLTCYCIYEYGCTYVIIDHCDLHDAADDIIEMLSVDDCDITWNRIHKAYALNCGIGGSNGHSDGIQYNGTCNRCDIIGNFIYDIPSTSCLYFVYTSNYYDFVVANNIFYNSGNTYYIVYLGGCHRMNFYNNIVWGFYNGVEAGDSGLGLNINNDYLDMRNNIISGINTLGGASWSSTNTGDYNLIYATPRGYYAGVNDIIGVDPKFTNINATGAVNPNPNIADFAPLDETAPSIDAGVAIAEVSYDIQHNSRPAGAGYDMGAFEYAGSIPSTGACCNPATGECSITTEAQCSFDWLGAGSDCSDCVTIIPTTGLVRSYTCDEASGYEAVDAAGFVPPIANVALNGTATQSSTRDSSPASRAIDGSTIGNQETITHTESEVTPWWEVDLGEIHNITEINIWGRTDQDQATRDRLSNFYVFVSDTAFASTDLATTLADTDIWNQFIVNTPDPNVLITVGRTGRYIRVQLGDTNYLSLAEVEIEGTPLPSEGESGSLINTLNGYTNGTTEFTDTEVNHEGEIYFDNIYDGLIFPTINMQAGRGSIAAAIYPETVIGLAPGRVAGDAENYIVFGHGVGTWSNRIQLWITNGYLQIGMGDNHFLATDVVAIDADTWYHVILTWLDSGITITNGTATGTLTGAGIWHLYLDSIEVGTGSYSGLNELSTVAAFGNTSKNIYPHNIEAFDGYMDNLKVYDIPLTSAQAADLAFLDDKEIIILPPAIDPPVIINTAAVSITALQATLGGEITDTGGEIPLVTLYYGDDDAGEVAGDWDNSVSIGAVLDSFTLPIGGLTHNTTYYYKCYATNAGGSDWASTSTFNTLEVTAPTLTQNAASNIRVTTVTLSGDITDQGNETPSILLYYGDNDGVTTPGNWDEFVSVPLASDDSLSIDITGLAANTTHYFRFLATNSTGSTWGSASLTFDTDPTGVPTIINVPATDIRGTRAIIGGDVTDVGLENPTVTLYWGISDGGVTSGNWDNAVSFGVQTGEFEVLLTGLTLATVYYYRTYATNSYGNDWANSTQSFSTLAVQPISPDPNDKIDGFLWGSYDNAYEIATPYANEDIFDIHKVSRADVTFIAHNDYHPQKLTRLADKDWTIEPIDFVGGPFLTMNKDEDKTIQYVNGTGGTTGNYYDKDNTGTLDAVGDTPFLEEMVGSLYLVQHTRQDNTVDAPDNVTHATPTGEGVRVQGDWQFDVSNMTAGTPNYTAKIWRKAVPGEWQELKHFSGASLASGTEDEKDVFYTWTASHTDVEGVFTAGDQINKGIVKITSFISTSQVSCIIKAAVYQESGTSAATSMYAEGAWNDYRGFPKTVTFYGNRLWWASTTYNPQGIWGSRVGYYEDHTGGVVDSDAVSAVISDNDVSSIEWITASQNFVIGSAKKEYIASAADKRDPITPKDMDVKPHSTNGSKHIQPVEIGGGMMYAQRIGYKMLILSYKYLDDAYDSQDANRLAPHMFKHPAVDISKQGTPETVVWVTREDGTLCPFRYDKDEEISAWSRIVTGSELDSPTHAFISTAVIAGSSEDRVWTVVERLVNGITYYYVERFAYRNYTALSDSLFLDSARTVLTDGQGTLSRLYYLEGHTVTIMKDTEIVGTYQINTGQITGLEANTVYTIGLPYLCRMKTMAFAVPGQVTEGTIKRCLSVILRTVRTRGGQVGCETHGQANMVDLEIPYSLLSADIEAFGEGGYTKEGRVILEFNDPYPAIVLAIVFDMEIVP